jgi:hypothetical protein
LLVYVGPQAHTLLGIVIGLCGGLGRHTSLGIVVGLCGATGNTHNWLLLVYEGPLTTHFTGCCGGLCEVSGNTLYWASLGLMWATFINGFKIIFKKK